MPTPTMAALREGRVNEAERDGTGRAALGGDARVAGLVLQLEIKRRQLGLRHGAFASELGVTRNMWYRLRTGNRDPSVGLVQRVLRRWPGEFEHLLPELVLSRRARGARRGSAS
jgi:hypothetical protein